MCEVSQIGDDLIFACSVTVRDTACIKNIKLTVVSVLCIHRKNDTDFYLQGSAAA